MICSDALSSSNDLLLEATSRRLKALGLQTLQATDSGDAETVTALFAQFIDCAYRSYALEERWLKACASPDREAHLREHTYLIELTAELYMNLMDDDRRTCTSIRQVLQEAFLPHITIRDRALILNHHTVAS